MGTQRGKIEDSITSSGGDGHHVLDAGRDLSCFPLILLLPYAGFGYAPAA